MVVPSELELELKPGCVDVTGLSEFKNELEPDCVDIPVISELKLELTSACVVEAYGTLASTVDDVILAVVVVSLEVADEVVTMIVVPLITVTVDTVDAELVPPLGRIGDWFADWEDVLEEDLPTPVLLEPDPDKDAEDVAPLLVLIGVVRLELEEAAADVIDPELLDDESELVLVGLKTPLVNVKDEVDVAFLRQESGIVKQQGKPVLVEEGLRTPP